MESENKSSSGGGGSESGVKERENNRNVRLCDVVLRFLAVALSLAATAVVGINKKTPTVSVTLPPMNVTVTSKWHYVFASVLFVVANAIACCYATMSLLVTLVSRDGKKRTTILIIVLDLLMVAIMFYAVGATSTIGLVELKGNSQVCNVLDKFCDQTTVAVSLSGAAATAFFFMVVLAALNLHNKH